VNLTAWRKQRVRILVRDNYKCRLQLDGCTGIADTVDHLVPWMPGTIVHDSQLVAACKHCNCTAGSPEKRNPEIPRPAWLN
jgi:5-methylcytosine-specific restriction endonuclease McrA